MSPGAANCQIRAGLEKRLESASLAAQEAREAERLKPRTARVFRAVHKLDERGVWPRDFGGSEVATRGAVSRLNNGSHARLVVGSLRSAADGTDSPMAPRDLVRDRGDHGGLYVSPAKAQGTAGAITGTVVDPIGAVLPGAAVTVTSTGTNEVRTTFTDGAGVYVVANLTAGTYRVEVQLQGFNRFARIDAQVQADTVTRVDVTLALGDFAATVTVTAERRTTDVQKTPLPVTVLSGRELEEKGVERMEDLQFATPLMTVDNAALTQNVTIRGIGLKSGSPRASSGVAVYRDGVLVPPILNQTSFFDIGSVETLRGPQGTFAGSYSTGGAVYINSRDPDFNGVSGT